MTTTTKHNHNGGKALPFGRKMPEGQCPRCDELRAGAPARSMAWAEHANMQREYDRREAQRAAENRARGLCSCGKPNSPDHSARCTYGEW